MKNQRIGTCFLVILVGGMPGAAHADETFGKLIAPFLQRHCMGCHGGEKQSAQIRFDRVEDFQARDRNLWTMIHEKVAGGEMPPRDRARPGEAEKKAFLDWIVRHQETLVTGTTRRLNRRELSAALRDVTGLQVDYAQGLTGDGTVAGFDTGAEGLQDAADGVVQGMRVARRAVDAIRSLGPANSKPFVANLREAQDARKTLDEWKNDGATVRIKGLSRPGMGLLLEPRAPGERDVQSVSIPVAADGRGVLRLRLVVSVMKPMPGLPNPRLWVEIGGRDIDFAELTGSLDKPQELVYLVQLEDVAIQPKGVTIALSNKIEVPYGVPGFENDDRTKPEDNVPGGAGLFRPVFDRKLPPEKQPAPYILLHEIEIDPNYVAVWPPAEWKVNPGPMEDSPQMARRLLDLWLERAWRRPATEAETEPFWKLYVQLRSQRRTFDEALRAAFQATLLSAPFRYLASPAHRNPVISQHAIASRLSFFLLGEPPDAELRRLASEGKLHDPAVREAQVDRLLKDPRFQSGFVRPFVTQWLELEQPITIAQNHIQKVDFRFARYLKASMKNETVGYVGTLLGENRPVRELIDSDWTLMNDTLARHYGYPPLEGGELRKVKLRENDPRGGGLLGHSGIQSMLCWMGDNWVIYRGAWALRHIFDMPPPPPPLEVPELNPAEGANRGKTFRALLKQHQEDGRCSVCHRNIDPVGFAFQNFDLSGRWREVEYEHYKRGELDGRIAWLGEGKTRPVDTAGALPRGETFNTFAEFKELTVQHYQKDLVRGLLKNFLIYAVGRTADVREMQEITRIMQTCEERGYPLRDLIVGLVRSPVFLDQVPRTSVSQPRN